MPNYITKSARATCECPPTGYVTGSNIVAVDKIDGNPAEYGTFTANIDDFGIDRDNTSESADLRTLLGLPAPSIDSNGDINLLYRYGSGIKVDSSDHNYHIWKAFRYDCGCSYYDCSGTDITGNDALPLPCFVERYIDGEGELDFSNDKISIIPILSLSETQNVGAGIRYDGSLVNYLTVDGTTSPIPVYAGIPTSGSFKNYVDPYGIVHSARWTISNDILDITFTTKDPRIPGEPEIGRVFRDGRNVRIFRTGVVTVIRQLLRVTSGGYAIIGEGTDQRIAEFQTTFGCGDISSDTPVLYKYDNNILDQVEFESGTIITQDPEPSAEYQWWPSVSVGTSNTFTLPDTGRFGPVTVLPKPSE